MARNQNDFSLTGQRGLTGWGGPKDILILVVNISQAIRKRKSGSLAVIESHA